MPEKPNYSFPKSMKLAKIDSILTVNPADMMDDLLEQLETTTPVSTSWLPAGDNIK